jgi:hypothetical protein
MSFAVRLATDVVHVDAGSTVAVSVELANRSDAGDEYELQVEGLDPDWLAIPVPQFTADAHEERREKFFLKPPRTSESVAGSYPFVVRVRSLVSGESRSAQAVLEIRPYHHLSLDVNPKRGLVSAFARECEFEVTVMNLGNSEHTLQLHAADPDEAVAGEFEHAQITLGPGHQKSVVLTCTASRRPLLSNARLHPVSVSARSLTNPTVAAGAQTQLEQRALFSPTSLLAVLFLAIVALAWFVAWPKPPVVESLSLDRSEATVGESVTISWSSAHARYVRLRAGGETIDRLSPTGTRTFVPKEAGVVTIEAVAFFDRRLSEPISRVLTVKEPVKAPDPKILEFKITPTRLNVGDTFAVRYRLSSGVTTATLSPPGLRLDPMVPEIELEAQREGKITYRLIAVNRDGKKVEQEITVNVVQGSRASIVLFRGSPMVVDPADGRVTLSWQLENAVRAEIRGVGDPLQVDPKAGSRELIVTKPVTVTLVGFDEDGRTVERRVKIEVKNPPPPPAESTGGTGEEPPPTTAGGPPSSGGTGGGGP